jgi:acetylornithine/succinyldiaminopimelate/putrescine aminotransferase
VSNVGHNNPAVVEAVCAQARNYMHCMVYGELVERVQVQYAKRLTEYLPYRLDTVYFVNSGAEAIEGAMKLAKRATGRTEIFSFHNAYHGSTQGAMSIMGSDEFLNGYRPLLPDTHRLRYNNFEDLERITERTACVVVECVQAEAGVCIPIPGFLEALDRRCKAAGALLVVDEIQTAFGRCGTMFASEQSGILPDIICLAKALGGGMPLGAFVSSNSLMSNLQHDPVLGHITTFGGHPVCCAAGLAAFEYILEADLLKNSLERGEQFRSELSSLELRHSGGLMIAVELHTPERMHQAVQQLLKQGYMTDWFLFCDTAIRISPPLIITPEQVTDCCSAILKALR